MPTIPPAIHPRFHRTGVGAYRIRPPWRGSCTFNDGEMFAVVIAFSLTSGRMRYAPTDFVFIHWNNNDDTTAYNDSFLPEKLLFFGLSFLSFALTLNNLGGTRK